MYRLDPWECEQETWTPTRQILEHFQDVADKQSSGQERVKLLCGADLIESFATPGLWAPDDVRICVCIDTTFINGCLRA